MEPQLPRCEAGGEGGADSDRENTVSTIHDRHERRTPASAALMRRAANSMPHGVTRTLSWFDPYPVVFERGEGAYLYDIDGNRYLDLFANGLSLIHGHRYPPIERALAAALERGTAWPGASRAQVEFAELLCRRVPGAEQVRFANTGTEATMLGVKLARHVTGRTLIVKGWHAYHGSYEDLEAGLAGAGEMPGRVALATFGAIETYETQLDCHRDEVAAILVEPVQYTGVVTLPPEGFLAALQQLAREAGVLFILDDCLMFRLAEGGSSERFALAPADITCLGKWIGGGLPVGAIAASRELMSAFDPCPGVDGALYHGGSFNGNPLGATAGTIAVADLDAAAIARMDAQTEALREGIAAAAESHGVHLITPGVGSVFGLYVCEGPARGIDWDATRLLHLAASTRGVYYGSGGECALNTAISDEDVEQACSALAGALADLAAVANQRV